MPKAKKTRKKEKKEIPPESTGLFFLDSGAHSLYNIHVGHGKKEEEGATGDLATMRKYAPSLFRQQRKTSYDFFDTKEFWDYVDSYANFVKEYQHAIDYHANVDVLFNPELSWKVLKYLENEHGLNPVPVIHFNTPIKWLHKHLDAGYDYIGIGGLGQEISKASYYQWADQMFSVICDNPKRLPMVRTHGFAMTAYDLLVRYPWWSVDSSSWAKAGGFGRIYVPHKSKGVYTFDRAPYTIAASKKSPASKERGRHVLTLSEGERRVVTEWLNHVGIELGEFDEDGNEKVRGVITHFAPRMMANLRFFEALVEWLPDWPWPFKGVIRKGFL